jgi:CysZ protein
MTPAAERPRDCAASSHGLSAAGVGRIFKDRDRMEGLLAMGGGIGFVAGTPRVWPYAAVPLVMLIVLACGLGGFGLYGADWTTRALVGEPESTWGQVGGWVVEILLFVVAIFLALLLAILLAQPLSGYALEEISLAQERALVGHAAPEISFLGSIILSLRIVVVTLVACVVVYAALFVVELVFPPVLVVTLPLRVMLGGWLIAWNFLDYPLSLHGLGTRARVAWFFRHFWDVTIFGLCWAGLLLIPGIFLVILPMGVAGATQLYVMHRARAASPAARS